MLTLFLGEKKGEEGYKEHIFSGKKATKQDSVDTREGGCSQALTSIHHNSTVVFPFIRAVFRFVGASSHHHALYDVSSSSSRRYRYCLNQFLEWKPTLSNEAPTRGLRSVDAKHIVIVIDNI
jgi:hypothetical protein